MAEFFCDAGNRLRTRGVCPRNWTPNDSDWKTSARAENAGVCGAVSLWDDVDGFFKDIVVDPDGRVHYVDVFSWIGIIPLFACEVIDARLLANRKRFNALLWEHKGACLMEAPSAPA